MEKIDKIYEELEEIRFKLQTLKDETDTKQYCTPTVNEILIALSEFLESDLNHLIGCVEIIENMLEEIEFEGDEE